MGSRRDSKARYSDKEKLYEKAGRNIAKAQKKDKEYYDKKHCDSQVPILRNICSAAKNSDFVLILGFLTMKIT